MPAPSLSLVKQWARIDGDEFDATLPTMIESATAVASHETGRDYSVEDMPAPVRQYVAATVSYWVNNPDAASTQRTEPSPFLARLLDPYRVY